MAFFKVCAALALLACAAKADQDDADKCREAFKIESQRARGDAQKCAVIFGYSKCLSVATRGMPSSAERVYTDQVELLSGDRNCDDYEEAPKAPQLSTSDKNLQITVSAGKDIVAIRHKRAESVSFFDLHDNVIALADENKKTAEAVAAVAASTQTSLDKYEATVNQTVDGALIALSRVADTMLTGAAKIQTDTKAIGDKLTEANKADRAKMDKALLDLQAAVKKSAADSAAAVKKSAADSEKKVDDALKKALTEKQVKEMIGFMGVGSRIIADQAGGKQSQPTNSKAAVDSVATFIDAGKKHGSCADANKDTYYDVKQKKCLQYKPCKGYVHKGVCVMFSVVTGNSDRIPSGCSLYNPGKLNWQKSDYVTLCVEGAKASGKYGYMTSSRCGSVDRDANGGLCTNRRGAVAWEVLASQSNPDVWANGNFFGWNPANGRDCNYGPNHPTMVAYLCK